MIMVLFCLLPIQAALCDHHIDPELTSYKPEKQLKGTITSRGSDTMRLLMHSWADEFHTYHPKVSFDIEAKGSGTAPLPLLKGESQIGPMSRKMKDEEYQMFIDTYGVRPIALGVGLDTLAVYVNIRNPIEKVSLVELDAVFSRTRNGGYPASVERWGQLGLSGRWEEMPISLYSRNTVSGTFEYFRNKALFKGQYKDSIQMQPDSAAVVRKVAGNPGGIGYSGIGYNTEYVKVLSLSSELESPAYSPSYENVSMSLYPLSRPLYIYVMKKPGEPVPGIIHEFLTFILSKEGQLITFNTGYMPLSAAAAKRQISLVR